MNQLLQKEPVRGATLEDVVRASKGKLFNNAAQAWNHAFYWNSLSPKKLRPSAALARRIDSDFGSQERFADQLAKAAADQFGSGWAWLIEDGRQARHRDHVECRTRPWRTASAASSPSTSGSTRTTWTTATSASVISRA
jgi:superoxide dismutase